MMLILGVTVLLSVTTQSLSKPQNGFEDARSISDKYDHDVSVLSWPYNEQTKKVLDEVNLMEWNPTIIAIQNITKGAYRKLKTTNTFLATTYEESGIDPMSENSNDEAICNPILFKGDRFRPVKDEEMFTGMYGKASGQISWTQLTMVNNLEDREKRDLPASGGGFGKGMEYLLSRIMGGNADDKEEEGCQNQDGSILVLNANLKEHQGLKGDVIDVIKDLYNKVMCRRRKKTILTGNVGWMDSMNAIQEFRHQFEKNGMPFQPTPGLLNVNQIWAIDFIGIQGTNSDLLENDGTNLKKTIKDRDQAVIAPSYVAFQHSLIKKQDVKPGK